MIIISAGRVQSFMSYPLAFAQQLTEKHGRTSVRVSQYTNYTNNQNTEQMSLKVLLLLLLLLLLFNCNWAFVRWQWFLTHLGKLGTISAFAFKTQGNMHIEISG